MKIGVDYFSLNYATGGIKRFIIEFLKRVPEIDKINDYQFIDIKNTASKIYSLKDQNIKNISLFSPRAYRALATFLRWPHLDTFSGAKDLFIFLNFISYPVSKDARKIVFIYDTSFLKFPEYVSKKNRYLLKKMVPRAIKEADTVITISESVKSELVDTYKVSSEKVEILYMGIDDKFKHVDDQKIIDAARSKYGITKKYFLYVSTIEPRKNVQGIINAYNKLPKDLLSEYQLVLVGGKGWLDSEILETINSSHNKDSIVLPGFVEDKYLIPLYSGAAAFVYPSFYEGFGIPILEAMACGAPVITSDTSSMPEVAGDAALLVDPNNTDEIKMAMETLAENKATRQELIQRGYEQIKKFSWDKTFFKLVDIINKVGNK